MVVDEQQRLAYRIVWLVSACYEDDDAWQPPAVLRDPLAVALMTETEE